MTTRTPTKSASPTRFDRRTMLVASAAALAIALGASVSGQQAGQDVRGTQTASVNFMVVAKDGQPVSDLKAEEVTLRIDAKVRPIRSLQYVRVSSPIGGREGAAPAPPPEIGPAFATNLATAADLPRSIVLVIDDEAMPIGSEVKIRAALNAFVRDLPPNDQVALVTVPHGGIKVGLTADREKMRKEIANISPISPIADAACQTLQTLQTLQGTLDQLTRTTDQPVAVAFLAATLSGASTMESAPRPAAGGASLSSQAGGCHLVNDDFVRIGQAVAAARAQFYIINPDYSMSGGTQGIENLQGQTGAPLFHLSAGTEPGLYRLARETSAYYTATFDTEPDELVGKPHPTTIKLTRDGVDVRYRPYLVVGRAAPTAHAVSPTGTTVTTAFDMVRSGKQFRDLPLRATASSFRNANGTVNVIALFEPTDSSVKIMTAAAALIDENGMAKEFWTGEADKMTAWPTALGLTVKPGRYRLRVGAIDSTGRLGLIDSELVAEVRQAGPLQISELLLGLQPGGKFSPRLQFTKEPAAVAYLELYGATEGTQVGAVFEVANTTDGKAFMTLPGQFAPTGEDGKYGVTATIQLGALAPGDYVVRAIVGAAGQPAARVIRTLHKAG